MYIRQLSYMQQSYHTAPGTINKDQRTGTQLPSYQGSDTNLWISAFGFVSLSMWMIRTLWSWKKRTETSWALHTFSQSSLQVASVCITCQLKINWKLSNKILLKINKDKLPKVISLITINSHANVFPYSFRPVHSPISTNTLHRHNLQYCQVVQRC